MSFQDAFEDRPQVQFKSIVEDDTGITIPDRITFSPYDSPDISVDVSGRFATHEIIGGVVVRQKIGESPINISVKGVCDEQTAKEIDQLRNAKEANFISERISMKVQIGSASSSPLESGGAVDMNTGRVLYSYNLNLIGIEAIEPETAN